MRLIYERKVMDIKNNATAVLTEIAVAVVIYVTATVAMKTGKAVYRKFRPVTPPTTI
jgi:hypothetical protein